MAQSQKTKAKDTGRLASIDMMVGMAMVLVVLGHVSVGDEPGWYSGGLHNWIYTFHMELFVFLSSFLICHAYKGIESPLEYFKYIWRKIKKFFPAYLIVGMVVSVMTMRGGGMTAAGLWQSLRMLLLYPRLSEASFLWYIYVLFGFYIVSPFFFRLPQWGRVAACVGAMFLAMTEAGPLCCAYEFSRYTFFYCLGVLCAEWIAEIRAVKLWAWGLMSLPFVVYSVWFFTDGYSLGVNAGSLGWWTLVTGVASLPFFYLSSRTLVHVRPLRDALVSVSKNCYIIYLLQMFVIWGCDLVARRAGIRNAMPFGVFAATAALLALAVPIALGEGYNILKDKRKKRDSQESRPAKNTSLK